MAVAASSIADAGEAGEAGRVGGTHARRPSVEIPTVETSGGAPDEFAPVAVPQEPRGIMQAVRMVGPGGRIMPSTSSEA